MTSRFFYGWVVAAVAALGIACSFSVLVVTITPIFAGPLAAEMGWSLQQIYAGPFVAGTTGLLSGPLIGILSDKFGARRIVLISFGIEVLVLLSFRYLNHSIFWFLARYAALAILCMGTTQIVFSRIISSWFNRRLGLAIGIGLAGVGVGGYIWSRVLQALIEYNGWRNAYLELALLIACIVLPLQALLLRPSAASMGLHIDGAASSTQSDAVVQSQQGMTLWESLHTSQYWIMVVAFFLLGASLQGAQLNVVPLLETHGESAQQAVIAQSYMLATIILGRLLSGYLLDRFFAPRVAQVFLMAPVIGLSALTLGATGSSAVLSAMCIGLAIGGESDVIAFLVRRYFGMRKYSLIYGTFFSAFGGGSAIGPISTAWGVAHTAGGYGSVLWVHVSILIVVVLMFFGLKNYSRE